MNKIVSNLDQKVSKATYLTSWPGKSLVTFHV